MPIDRPVSPAEFAVRFGLEPVDVEWIMRRYKRGLPAQEVARQLMEIGCTETQLERLMALIVEATRGPNEKEPPRSER
jgi:hypothetical protein